MLVSGEIENVPLLDVLQVVSFSKQTGVLEVEESATRGAVLFDGGNIVCAESTSTGPLLARAAREQDPRTRLALTRISTLATLTELLALRRGVFRFKNAKARPAELAGTSTQSFYDAGPLDTGELLLVLATSVDKPKAAVPDTGRVARQVQRSHPRYAPTVLPATVDLGTAPLSGHLTNVSAGGGFFQADVLPPELTSFRLRITLPAGEVETLARVVWVRTDKREGPVGAGIAFHEMSEEARASLESYLVHFQSLAKKVETSASPAVSGSSQ